MKVNHNKIFKYYQQGIYPIANKLYVLGDIHGDFNAFIICLRKAKLIDNKYHWIGRDSHVVQVGDILDRKIRSLADNNNDEDSEFKIISLICNLQLEAYIAGGGFHPIIGNHELMNILGIFDYVSPMGLKHFKTVEERYNYFKIGGIFCKYLACAWNPVIKIGDFIFCHGGLNVDISNKYSINDINYIMRDTLYGNKKHIGMSYFSELFLNNDSILWNRTYSSDLGKFREFKEEKNLKKILNNYEVKYMVVGHTPTESGIKTRFNGQVLCADTGMSEAFGYKKNKNDRIHYIEIISNSSENKIILH